MYTSFYIKEGNLNETKDFIRCLPSARFKHNPLKEGDKYNVALNISVEDCNKLNILLNRYYDEEHINKASNKITFINKVRSFFNCL